MTTHQRGVKASEDAPDLRERVLIHRHKGPTYLVRSGPDRWALVVTTVDGTLERHVTYPQWAVDQLSDVGVKMSTRRLILDGVFGAHPADQMSEAFEVSIRA